MSKNIELWPAIDLIDGKPVRLLKGDYAQKTEYALPLSNVGKIFSQFAHGIHVVDLDGAKVGKPVNLEAITEIISHSEIPVEVGGGIRNRESIQILLNLGVSRVILGTSALKDPDFLGASLEEFGAEKIVVGVDAKDGFVATHGWEEKSEISAEDFIQKLQDEFGVKIIIFTDIATDGTLAGPPLNTFEALSQKFSNISFIASGGVANIQDISQLQKTGVDGVIFGKAFYEGKISKEELKTFS